MAIIQKFNSFGICIYVYTYPCDMYLCIPAMVSTEIKLLNSNLVFGFGVYGALPRVVGAVALASCSSFFLTRFINS